MTKSLFERATDRPTSRRLSVKTSVGISAVCLAAQTALTDYGDETPQRAAFWFAIGLGLLATLYWRRSRVARGVIVVPSLIATALYLFVQPGWHHLLLAALFAAQAAPLMTRAVADHVRRPSADITA